MTFRTAAAALAALTAVTAPGLVSVTAADTPTRTPATTSAAATATSLARGGYAVDVADYTLGDTALRLEGAYRNDDPKQGLAPIELTGRVYYPRTRTHRPRPMVLMLHGLWTTCADRSASLLNYQATALQNEWAAAHPATAPRGQKPQPVPNPRQAELDRISAAATAKLYRWPCAKGTPSLPSYRGYDYLGRSLASHGMTVVSISANGINAVDLGLTAQRAALVNKHLAMWATLDRTGRGPLAGHFTRPGTTRPVNPHFRHTIDLHRVGTLGHSRGGMGVMWHAADPHRSSLPRGVRIAATVALAPAGVGGDDDVPQYRITRSPVLIWEGTCDAATGRQGEDYLRAVAGRSHQPYYRLLVDGANHNFLNTQWSPSSGQVDANDDNDEPGIARPHPGKCDHGDEKYGPQLGESAERATSRAYVVAFFLRELAGERRWQAVLDGRVRPLGTHVSLDIRKNPTAER